MEARIKSRNSARSLAQLVRAKRIILFIVQILCVIYENPKSIRHGTRVSYWKCVTLPRISYAFPADAWSSGMILKL